MGNDPLEKLSAEQLPKIHDSAPPETKAAAVGKKEEKALRDQIEIDKLTEEIRSLRQDIDERKKYADKSFKLVCHWISGVFVILLLQGFLSEKVPLIIHNHSLALSFKLPEGVLLAVVGGTTVSIIGIFLVVANYLFPKR